MCIIGWNINYPVKYVKLSPWLNILQLTRENVDLWITDPQVQFTTESQMTYC